MTFSYNHLGYISLFLILEAIAVMAYREVDLSFVTKNYWHLMISSIALTYFVSVFAFVLARWGQGLVINPWGNTGNIIVDFFHGRDVYPLLAGNFLTLVTNRIAMIGLALINVLLVWDSIIVHKVVNYAILVTALFQVLPLKNTRRETTLCDITFALDLFVPNLLLVPSRLYTLQMKCSLKNITT